MKELDVAIIGGGLSGLYLAYRLQQKGINFALFEAKPQLGGRILSVATDQAKGDASEKVDLGPTWFWPHQRHIQQVLEDLRIHSFEQYTAGDILYQLYPDQVPQRSPGAMAVTSYRIENGMQQLILGLYHRLDPTGIFVSTPLIEVLRAEGTWRLGFENRGDVNARIVVFAIPPRQLFAQQLLQPFISPGLTQVLQATPTWMAAQAKFVARYEQAFWREKGLSGDVFSRVGPMAEIHDASSCNGDAALFGFLGLPVVHRQQLSHEQLCQLCLRQLTRVFGEDAARPQSYFLKDWAQDFWVVTEEDIKQVPEHPQIDLSPFAEQLRSLNIYLAGSEYAVSEAGYLEGALVAAGTVFDELSEKLSSSV